MSATARSRSPGSCARPGARCCASSCSRLAVALLGAMLLFVGHSLRTMTASAVRSVPLDWQGPVGSVRAGRSASAAGVARQPGVAQASADRDRAVRRRATPPAPTRHDQRRQRRRARRPARLPARTSRPSGSCRAAHARASVVLDQQMAATLQAQIGDRSPQATPRAPAAPLPVSGVALVTAPDVLFQPLNPLLGPAPAQPPANVAIMPIDTFARQLRADAAVDHAGQRRQRAAVPGAQDGVQWQVQAQLDPAALSAAARAQALQRARRRRATASSAPCPARSSSSTTSPTSSTPPPATRSTRETLYIMLAVPGRADRARARVPRRARHGRARPPRPRAAARPRREPARPAGARGRRERSRSACVAGLAGAGARVRRGGDARQRRRRADARPRARDASRACVALAIAGAAAARASARAPTCCAQRGRRPPQRRRAGQAAVAAALPRLARARASAG